MKRLAVYNAAGNVLTVQTVEDGLLDFALSRHPAAVEVDAAFSPATHYVDPSARRAVAYAPEVLAARARHPGQGHEWRPMEGRWVDVRDLAGVKAAALARGKRLRDAQAASGFAWDGVAFDSDEAARLALAELADWAAEPLSDYPADGEPWRLADNTWRVLKRAEARQAYAALRRHVRQAWARYRQFEQQVQGAATAAQVEAVPW